MKSGIYVVVADRDYWASETKYYRNKNNAIKAIKEALFETEISDAYTSLEDWKETEPEDYAEVMKAIENCHYFDDFCAIYELETVD